MERLLALVIVACTLVAAAIASGSPLECTSAGLQLFASTQDFQIFANNLSPSLLSLSGPPDIVEMTAESDTASSGSTGTGTGSSAQMADESITNNQEEGVDEGGIVKAKGDFLIVLRRGRLFSARLGDTSLEVISAVNAFGPNMQPASWYDEMLVYESTIVVIGYAYVQGLGGGGGATEIGLFSISATGAISYESSHYIHSDDYYSSRNYASRLLGSRLILYMPHRLVGLSYANGNYTHPEIQISFPRIRSQTEQNWTDIMNATGCYQPVPDAPGSTLHTVLTCDLAGITNGNLVCSGHGVIGPRGRVFYVSPSAVFVWVAAGYSNPALLYRLPLAENDSPSALRVAGAPVDQLSFKDEGDWLSVLVRSMSSGDGMWSAEMSVGAVALFRVPSNFFRAGYLCTPFNSSFTTLPTPSSAGRWSFQNRHVGDFVLYGIGAGWGSPSASDSDAIFVYNRALGGAAVRLALPHAVDRIEAIGASAVSIGSNGNDLYFSTIILGSSPAVGGRIIRKDATQGETRTHGFFYKPQSNGIGILGLPLRGARDPGWSQLVQSGASIIFLRVADQGFSSMGELVARDGGAQDNCVASCVDWYGNSRPIFYQQRVFALMGYELVEGSIGADGGLLEKSRIHLLPEAQGVMMPIVNIASSSDSMTFLSAATVAECYPNCNDAPSTTTSTPTNSTTSGASSRSSTSAVVTGLSMTMLLSLPLQLVF